MRATSPAIAPCITVSRPGAVRAPGRSSLRTLAGLIVTLRQDAETGAITGAGRRVLALHFARSHDHGGFRCCAHRGQTAELRRQRGEERPHGCPASTPRTAPGSRRQGPRPARQSEPAAWGDLTTSPLRIRRKTWKPPNRAGRVGIEDHAGLRSTATDWTGYWKATNERPNRPRRPRSSRLAKDAERPRRCGSAGSSDTRGIAARLTRRRCCSIRRRPRAPCAAAGRELGGGGAGGR